MKTLKPLLIITGLSLALAATISIVEKAQALPSTGDINYQTMPLGAADGSCVVATHTATNLNLAVDMTRQRDIAMLFQFTCITDAVNTCEALLSPSLDGTTATMDTGKTIRLIGVGNTTTAVNILTNLSGGTYSGYSGVAGYRFLILRYITNATADFVTNRFIVPYKHGIQSGGA